MKHGVAIAISMSVLGGFSAIPCSAQLSLAPPVAPGQAVQTPAVGPQSVLPTTAVPGAVSPGATLSPPPLTPPTLATPAPVPGRSPGPAGRGLPGMSGGPPLNAQMGAGDPSVSYMRPSVIGPLFCDPAIDISC